jgi:signal transduction histidine kinase
VLDGHLLSPAAERRALRTTDSLSVAPSDRTIVRGLLLVRWTGVAAALLVLVVERGDLNRASLGVAVLLGLMVVTALDTVGISRDVRLGSNAGVLVLGLAVAVVASVADGWAFVPHHALGVTALATVWSLGTVGAAGAGWGPRGGLAAAGVVIAARVIGSLAPEATTFKLFREEAPPLTHAVISGALVVLAGVCAGLLRDRLKQTHGEAARREARAEVGAMLHDGVLQSLAYIRRRAADPDIARVARDADIELRAYLATPEDDASADLAAALCTSARRAEHQLGCHLELAIDDELPSTSAEVTTAVTGAVTEAITNAAKHASATKVTVFALRDNTGLRITITDDGAGFDPDLVPAGGGLDQSIRARLRNVGGDATITSRRGHGTTVELWAP